MAFSLLPGPNLLLDIRPLPAVLVPTSLNNPGNPLLYRCCLQQLRRFDGSDGELALRQLAASVPFPPSWGEIGQLRHNLILHISVGALLAIARFIAA